jgi:hypothetical protein
VGVVVCCETRLAHSSPALHDRDPEAFRALYGSVWRYLAARVHRSAVEDVIPEVA